MAKIGENRAGQWRGPAARMAGGMKQNGGHQRMRIGIGQPGPRSDDPRFPSAGGAYAAEVGLPRPAVERVPISR
jgi:hypothetical protein